MLTCENVPGTSAAVLSAVTASTTGILAFNASLVGRHHDDFPIPVPDLFPLPLTNVIGQPLYNNYLGQPPNDLTADVRFKILPHMILDVQRTYYFNFGNVRWSPNFIVQVLPQ